MSASPARSSRWHCSRSRSGRKPTGILPSHTGAADAGGLYYPHGVLGAMARRRGEQVSAHQARLAPLGEHPLHQVALEKMPLSLVPSSTDTSPTFIPPSSRWPPSTVRSPMSVNAQAATPVRFLQARRALRCVEQKPVCCATSSSWKAQSRGSRTREIAAPRRRAKRAWRGLL